LYYYLGKYNEIERENRILLEKMSNIMQDPKPKLYNPSKFTQNNLSYRTLWSWQFESKCTQKRTY
jgi:hypothetical protein